MISTGLYEVYNEQIRKQHAFGIYEGEVEFDWGNVYIDGFREINIDKAVDLDVRGFPDYTWVASNNEDSSVLMKEQAIKYYGSGKVIMTGRAGFLEINPGEAKKPISNRGWTEVHIEAPSDEVGVYVIEMTKGTLLNVVVNLGGYEVEFKKHMPTVVITNKNKAIAVDIDDVRIINPPFVEESSHCIVVTSDGFSRQSISRVLSDVINGEVYSITINGDWSIQIKEME